MSRLTSEHANQIAKKDGLETEVDEGRKHTSVRVRWGNKTIAIFYISRGSRTSPADYLSKQLHITTRQTLDLARCTFSAAQYYMELNRRGLLP